MSNESTSVRPRRAPKVLVKGYDWFKVNFPTIAFWFGLIDVIYFWVAVSIDAHLNASWWSFTASSFSALGDPAPNSTSAAAGLAWIYNDVVLLPTAIMILIFAAGLTMVSRNRLQSTGSSFLMVSGIFLELVAIDHGGTPYHDFVSEWFFIQAALGILVWSLGLLWERKYKLGLGQFVMIIGALVIGFSVKFGSVAEVEAFAIIVIDLWVLIMFLTRRPSIAE